MLQFPPDLSRDQGDGRDAEGYDFTTKPWRAWIWAKREVGPSKKKKKTDEEEREEMMEEVM